MVSEEKLFNTKGDMNEFYTFEKKWRVPTCGGIKIKLLDAWIIKLLSDGNVLSLLSTYLILKKQVLKSI